jgi:hypothetical protein
MTCDAFEKSFLPVDLRNGCGKDRVEWMNGGDMGREITFHSDAICFKIESIEEYKQNLKLNNSTNSSSKPT